MNWTIIIIETIILTFVFTEGGEHKFHTEAPLKKK